MQKIRWDKYEIEKLSKEDISSYFEMAYNNPIVKNMLNSSSSLSRATSNFQNFGNVLQAYVTATGDMSEEMVEKLATDFIKYSDKIYQAPNHNKKMEGIQVFFADHVLPSIMQHHMQKQGMKEPLTLEQTAVILKSIELNCANNRFHTHSFNGALLNEIQTNGFDINKELFQEEYKILRSVGMYQPYQTGNLLFCELSKASFGYAVYAPERLVSVQSHPVEMTLNLFDTNLCRRGKIELDVHEESFRIRNGCHFSAVRNEILLGKPHQEFGSIHHLFSTICKVSPVTLRLPDLVESIGTTGEPFILRYNGASFLKGAVAMDVPDLERKIYTTLLVSVSINLYTELVFSGNSAVIRSHGNFHIPSSS